MQGQRYKELGSEFWLNNVKTDNRIYVLSGRTAIDLIIQEMGACGKSPSSVYMPAYCCDSMILPFWDRGIEILFYDVDYQNGKLEYNIDANQKIDILYVNNYFGYDNTLSKDIIYHFKEHGATILYDRTHSLFREDCEYQDLADYTFASIRKWMGVPCGAFLSKAGKELHLAPLRDFPYIKDKIDAMIHKAAYMQGDSSIAKKRFMDLYGSFGHHLAEDYKNYKIDELSMILWHNSDLLALKNNRNTNATYLQVSLKEIPQIKNMFALTYDDCALFVPVLFESKEIRDSVRQCLTNESIYCPVHWPKPSIIPSDMKVNDIYDRELSLICDQRYNIDDMQHIVEILKKYFKNE